MNGHLFAEGPAELGGVASNYITHGRYLSFNPTIFTTTETNYSIRVSPFQSKGPQIPTNMSGTPLVHSFCVFSIPLYLHSRLWLDMPPKASKEELHKRAEELNQE